MTESGPLNHHREPARRRWRDIEIAPKLGFKIGIALLTGGILFFSFLLFFRHSGPLETAPVIAWGRVTQSERTGGKVPSNVVHYTFRAAGEVYQGRQLAKPRDAGQRVEIEDAATDPTVSRIRGTRGPIRLPRLMFFGALFSIVSIIAGGVFIHQARKESRAHAPTAAA